MKSGSPPTALKARTGLSTPPGRIFCARAKSFADVDQRGFFMGVVVDDVSPCRASQARAASRA